MAYVPGQEEEEDERLAERGKGALLTPSAANGQGATDGKPTGSGFVNLRRYLDVNGAKGNDMAKGLMKEGNAELEAVGSKADEFMALGSQLGKDVNFKQLNTALDRVGKAKYGDEIDDETKAFVDAGGKVDKYNGASAKDVDERLQAFRNAQDAAKAKGIFFEDSAQGKDMRAGKLRETFNKDGRYTTGEGSLDNFLASGSEMGGRFGMRKSDFDHAGDTVASQYVNDKMAGRYKDTIADREGQRDTYTERFGQLRDLLGVKLAAHRPSTTSNPNVGVPAPSANNPTAPIPTGAGNAPNPSVVGGPITTGGGGESPIEALINGVPTSTNELKNRVKIKAPKW